MRLISKVFLFSLCVHLIFLSLSTFSGKARAEENLTEGFIIEADRVVGSGVSVNVITQETSANSGKPMLRFQYESATIHGMKLTKKVNNQKGALSITLKADGPVTVKDMVVDVTAISFKGVCLKAGESLPELGMENIVMVAHYMSAADSMIQKLLLNTVGGDTGVKKPGKLKILDDLSLLPVNQLKKEVESITSGNLPLTCDQGEAVGVGTDPIKDVVEEVTNPVQPVVDSLDPVLEPLEPVLDSLDPVLEPLEPVVDSLDPVLEPVEPVLDSLDPILKPIEPVVDSLKPILKPLQPVLKPLQPVLEPVTKPLAPVVGDVVEIAKTTCEKLSDAKGVITKELALELIDEAVEKKVSLSKICQGDTGNTTTLLKWEEGLLSSLGIVDLIAKLNPINPIEQLYKMRATIEKTVDGTVVYGK